MSILIKELSTSTPDIFSCPPEICEPYKTELDKLLEDRREPAAICFSGLRAEWAALCCAYYTARYLRDKFEPDSKEFNKLLKKKTSIYACSYRRDDDLRIDFGNKPNHRDLELNYGPAFISAKELQLMMGAYSPPRAEIDLDTSDLSFTDNPQELSPKYYLEAKLKHLHPLSNAKDNINRHIFLCLHDYLRNGIYNYRPCVEISGRSAKTYLESLKKSFQYLHSQSYFVQRFALAYRIKANYDPDYQLKVRLLLEDNPIKYALSPKLKAPANFSPNPQHLCCMATPRKLEEFKLDPNNLRFAENKLENIVTKLHCLSEDERRKAFRIFLLSKQPYERKVEQGIIKMLREDSRKLLYRPLHIELVFVYLDDDKRASNRVSCYLDALPSKEKKVRVSRIHTL